MKWKQKSVTGVNIQFKNKRITHFIFKYSEHIFISLTISNNEMWFCK